MQGSSEVSQYKLEESNQKVKACNNNFYYQRHQSDIRKEKTCCFIIVSKPFRVFLLSLLHIIQRDHKRCKTDTRRPYGFLLQNLTSIKLADFYRDIKKVLIVFHQLST